MEIWSEYAPSEANLLLSFSQFCYWYWNVALNCYSAHFTERFDTPHAYFIYCGSGGDVLLQVWVGGAGLVGWQWMSSWFQGCYEDTLIQSFKMNPHSIVWSFLQLDTGDLAPNVRVDGTGLVGRHSNLSAKPPKFKGGFAIFFGPHRPNLSSIALKALPNFNWIYRWWR